MSIEEARREREHQLEALNRAVAEVREAVRQGQINALELTRAIAGAQAQLDESTVQRGLWLLLREGELELTEDSQLQLVQQGDRAEV